MPISDWQGSNSILCIALNKTNIYMTSFDFHRVPLRWSPFFFEDFLAEKLRKSMCVVANLGGGLGGWGEVILK